MPVSIGDLAMRIPHSCLHVVALIFSHGDAARLARDLVNYSPDAIGYMATTYPDSHEALAGTPAKMNFTDEHRRLKVPVFPCQGNPSLCKSILES